MDLAEILGAFRRQWVVLLLGIPACLGLAWVLAHPAPVYTMRSEVQFLRPSIDAVPNALSGGTRSLVATAGLIAHDVTPPTANPLTTTSDVDLAGLGVRHGSSVVLPNFGGQWAYNFASASLIIQSVGSSPEEVAARHRESLSKIEAALTAREDAARVTQEHRIRLRDFPVSPPVVTHAGHRSVALIMAVYVCLVPLFALTILVDRLRARRRRSRAERPARQGTGLVPHAGNRRSSQARATTV